MPPDAVSEKQQIQLLVETLSALPRVMETSLSENLRDASVWSDAKIELTLRDSPRVVILVETKGRSLFPRDVRDLLWTLNGDKRFQSPKPPIALLEAYSLSQGAKEILQQNEVGYFDSGGSLYIPAPGFYVLIDKPEPKPIEKKNRAMFKGKRAQVMHALLQHPGRWVSVKDIAEEATVSSATASETMSMLDLFDWMSSRGNGPSKERCLQKPRALLDAWVTQIRATRPPSYRRYYVSRTDAETLGQKITEASRERQVKCVLTGEVAAQHYAPHLSTTTMVRCKVGPGGREALVDLLSAEAVEDGANLLILESREDGDFLFSQMKDGLSLASPVVAYLDLIRGPGRAAELADHMRREVLGY